MPNPYETRGKYSPIEVNIFPKFHKNWAKIVDFLLGHLDFKIAFLMKLRLYHTLSNENNMQGLFIQSFGIVMYRKRIDKKLQTSKFQILKNVM